jgi:hypothetical protein
MKRNQILLLAILLMVCVLVGCEGATMSNQAELKPNSISLNDEIVTYGDTDIPDDFWQAGVNFKVNENNEIRYIEIEGTEVRTYKNISVGDSIDKVKSSFKYESEVGSLTSVLLNGEDEIEVSANKPMDNSTNYLWINYMSEDDVITKILIYDQTYGMYMK